MKRSPFHYFLINEQYEILNRLAESTWLHFKNFVNTQDKIKKITEMFIYTIENITSYPYNALETIYCELPFYGLDSDQCDESSKTIENIEKIENVLIEIKNKVEADKLYSERND